MNNESVNIHVCNYYDDDSGMGGFWSLFTFLLYPVGYFLKLPMVVLNLDISYMVVLNSGSWLFFF